MLGRETAAILFRQLAPGADTDKNVMRHLHVAALEPAVIRGHKRQPGRKRGIKEYRLGTLLGSKTMTLQLDIDTAGKRGRQGGKTFGDKAGLVIRRRFGDKAVLAAAGQQDHPLARSRQRLKRNYRIVTTLDRQQRLGIQPAQRRIAGLGLRQQHDLATAAIIAKQTFKADDRLHTSAHHGLREFQRPEHVVGVGNGRGRLRITRGKGRQLFQAKR